ncbi:MAG: hypothetical protein H0U76_19425 [Ktedonobacteraceae bacterium]|nr:hypothetical protein [Ktedonobacteraceae bacterium]
MAKTRHEVHGLTVELRTLTDGVYEVLHGADAFEQVQFSRADGNPRWYCACGTYQTVKLLSLLAHVVGSHSPLGKRPLLAVSVVAHAGDAASPTYLRLVGQHPDPTADAALRHICRH